MNYLFKIPVSTRTLTLHTEFNTFTSAVINGTGMFIEFDAFKLSNEDRVIEYASENVSRYLIGIENISHIYVNGETVENALEKFHKEWYGAGFFNLNSNKNAIWVDASRIIIRLPACERLYFQKTTSEYVCGKPQNDSLVNGEFGGCVIYKYHPPHDCPIHNYKPNGPPQKIIINEGELLFNPLEV